MTIPLVTITGFLGSGKTTFLRRVIESNPRRKLALVVNDFGEVDVDGRVLSDASDRVVALPGGSIFCRCLVTTFIGAMRELADRWHTEAAPLEGVLVEASGIADPRVLPQMLAETGLDETYRLARVVTLIDPGTFAPLLHTLPNITAQVQAASVGILNKADLYDASVLAETERAVHEVNPSLEILRATQASCRLVDWEELFRAVEAPDAGGTYAPCRDPHFVSARWTGDRPIDAERLRVGLSALGDRLYRAKGVVRTVGGCLRLEASAGGVAMWPVADDPCATDLVFIFAPQLEQQVNDLEMALGYGNRS
jgi:G3E family GTPase